MTWACAGRSASDLAQQTQYCGMFLTPTLRNVDRRHVFFHNGIYHTLKQVLDFYNLRAVAPEKIYPRGADGQPLRYNDLPDAYQANVDTADAPFDRHVGDPPPLTDQDMQDILSFLHTLDDGYVGNGDGVAPVSPAARGKPRTACRPPKPLRRQQ